MPLENFKNHKSNKANDDQDNFLFNKSWTTRDFVDRYTEGTGQTVDLSNIGLLDRFRNTHSVRNAIRGFELKQMKIAEGEANNICGRTRRPAIVKISFSNNDSTVTDVTQDGPLFSVGHSTLFRYSRCLIEVDCSKRIIRLEGTMTFEIKDWFRNPLDIGIEMPKSKIYRIVAKWSQPMNFTYDRLGTGRWVRN